MRYQQQQEGERQKDNYPFLEDAGIDPAASRMLSERSTI